MSKTSKRRKEDTRRVEENLGKVKWGGFCKHFIHRSIKCKKCEGK